MMNICINELSHIYHLNTIDLDKIRKREITILKGYLPKEETEIIAKFVIVDPAFLHTHIDNFILLSNLGKSKNVIHYRNVHLLNEVISEGVILVEILEYANFGTLADFVQNPRNFSEIIEIFRQALQGFEFLHSKGILHRDIKPTNILLTKFDCNIIVKICDIELSPQQFNGIIRTTPEYLAPEVVNYQSYTVHSELWAIGIMIYELFTGEYPFGTRKEGSTIEEIREMTRTITPTKFFLIPDPFRRMAQRCLKKEPSKREKSVRNLMKSLSLANLLYLAVKKKFLT